MFASLDGRTKVWEPLPRQAAALTCPAFEVLYGGQKGGGKTDVLVARPIPVLQMAHKKWVETKRKQHRCRVVLFRKNLDDLIDIIARTKELYPVLDPTMGEAGFHTNEKVWRFTSGARLELRHLDGPDDHRGYNGQELRGIGFDQLEEHEEEVYTFLLAQVRTTDPDFQDLLFAFSTANPGGRHGDWVYKRFIQPHEPGNRILETEVTNRDGSEHVITRAFVPATLTDNKYLNADGRYEANLRANLMPHQIKQYLEGDWHVVVGAYFAPLIIPRKHSMTWAEFLDRFPGGIPSTWDLGYGLDWGSTAPAALELGARDGDDRLWVFEELYQPGGTGRQFGEAMHQLWASQKWSGDKKWKKDEPWGSIDPQAWGKYGSEGMVAAEGIESWGFRIFPAQKDRQAGITQLRERLALRPDGLPGLIVISDRCPKLWRSLQTVRTCPKDQNDYDRSDNPHAVDAIRFLAMEWPCKRSDDRDPQDAQVETWARLIARHNARTQATNHQTTGYDD